MPMKDENKIDVLSKLDELYLNIQRANEQFETLSSQYPEIFFQKFSDDGKWEGSFNTWCLKDTLKQASNAYSRLNDSVRQYFRRSER